MARICEVCGRVDDNNHEDDIEHDLLDVCASCTSDRQQHIMSIDEE
ncbi:hypothetical protein M3212_19840 [Alkalihalobacillus oceani]|nr:hypothetical protein [Halalkalibacter oceani]MCM3762981.1 hypothetical protein [Halalkalibacter oceani]